MAKRVLILADHEYVPAGSLKFYKRFKKGWSGSVKDEEYDQLDAAGKCDLIKPRKGAPGKDA